MNIEEIKQENTGNENYQNNFDKQNPLSNIISEISQHVDNNKIEKITWWNNIPKKERFILGDIIYCDRIDKFGVFAGPSRKEGLIKLRPFKYKTKDNIHNRDWYLSFEEVVLVKRYDKLKRGFFETEKQFLRNYKNII